MSLYYAILNRFNGNHFASGRLTYRQGLGRVRKSQIVRINFRFDDSWFIRKQAHAHLQRSRSSFQGAVPAPRSSLRVQHIKTAWTPV